VWLGLECFHRGGSPSITIEPALPGIAKRTPVTVTAREPRRGITRLQVALVQGSRRTKLADKSYKPLAAWRFWSSKAAPVELHLEVGSETLPSLESGEATITVTAVPASAWLLHGRAATQSLKLPVRFSPPAVAIESRQNYVAQGGCGVVVYHLGAGAVKNGVEVGKDFFPGFALPGGQKGDRFAFYAVPFNDADPSSVHLVAMDELGNRASVPFLDEFFVQKPREDTIHITDAFLARAVPAILAHTPGLEDRGSLLENFLEINGALRKSEAEDLRELAKKSKPAFLWHQTFERLPRAAAKSSFADHRTYLYKGKVIDHQNHMGIDLASVEHAAVPAANSGVVLMAHYFGIYGNAVVIDHGYGLMSLYGHLSSFAVKEGDHVRRGQVIGHTGETGLAGGDHLHFTMLLDGVPVKPHEWWDPHWIHDRIASKLGKALDFTP